jgi:phage regulator Rha-like protein
MKNLEQTLDSREVAEMIEKTHANLLKDIRRYCKQFGEVKIDFSDFSKNRLIAQNRGKNFRVTTSQRKAVSS